MFVVAQIVVFGLQGEDWGCQVTECGQSNQQSGKGNRNGDPAGISSVGSINGLV